MTQQEAAAQVDQDARTRGITLSPEQRRFAISVLMRGNADPAQERTAGAPSGDIGSDPPLLQRPRATQMPTQEPPQSFNEEVPESYLGDLQTGARMAAGADRQVWLEPGNAAFENEGDLLAYRDGMSEEEYNAAKANRAHRVRLLRGMSPDPGGYTEFNPQQPMWLGTAEDQQEWNDWVAADPERMRRFDPAGYAAYQQAQENEFRQQHYEMLAEKYGHTPAQRWLENRMSGGPVDFSILRSPLEQNRIDARRQMEQEARGIVNRPLPEGAPVLDRNGQVIENPDELDRTEYAARLAREELAEMDRNSGLSGALANEDMAAGLGPDGEPETKGARLARSMQERKEDLDARKLALRNQRMLAGSNPANNMANAYTLMGDPFNDGLTENQRRALEYMLPSGRLAAEVDARNMEEAAGIAARGLQSVLLPSVLGNAQGGGEAGGAEGRNDVEGGANGTWRTPAGVRYLVEMSDLFDSPDQMAEFLVNNYGYTPAEAELATQKAKAERYLPWGM